MAPFHEGADQPPTGPPPSQIQTGPDLVHFDPKAVVPSQTIYLQRNDQITLNILTNANGVILRVLYRWLTPAGEIKEGEFDTPPFNLNIGVGFPLFEGWLLSFGLRVTSGTVAGQWLFAQVQVARGISNIGGTPPSGNIWQGFVYGAASTGWPGTPSKEITDGAGALRSITGTVPAAGAEISEAVPANRRWNLLAIKASLTTSAAAGNRNATLALSDGANFLYGGNSYFNQIAATTIQYSGFPSSPQPGQLAGNTLLDLLMPINLRPGSKVFTSTLGLLAGDQWTAPQYLVAEWGQWDA